jgi:hypothetical protein
MATDVLTARRAVRIILRTGHIAAVVGVVGSLENRVAWAGLLLASGGGIALLDLERHGADLFRYLQGQAVLAKLALLALGILVPWMLMPALWACLVIGAVISHAPGSIRQHTLWGPKGPCAMPDKSGERRQ